MTAVAKSSSNHSRIIVLPHAGYATVLADATARLCPPCPIKDVTKEVVMKICAILRKPLQTSRLSVAVCQKLLQRVATGLYTRVPTARGAPQAASACAMLVESDIKGGVRGIVP